MSVLGSDSFLRFFKYSSPVMLLIDPSNSQIVDANQSACDFYGYALDKLIGSSITSINIMDEDAIKKEMQRALKEERNFFNFHHRLAKGEVRDVEVYSTPIEINNQSLLFSIIHDVTKRRLAEEALVQREILLKQIMDTSSVAIFLVDMQGYIIHANQRMAEMFGYELDVLLTKEYVELIHPSEREVGRAKMLALMAKKIPSVSVERIYWRSDEQEFWGHLSGKRLYSPSGEDIGLVGVIADISEKKSYEKKLEQIAHYDVLTQLPNRILFYERLKYAMQKAQRNGTLIAVVYIDLDGFKEINDTYGHDTGDKFLIAIASCMQETLRESDTLARLGGDEFVATLVDLRHVEDCIMAIERLLNAANEEIVIDTKVLQASASIGIALYPKESEDADQLVRYADQAMYHAKKRGKNCYAFFNQNL